MRGLCANAGRQRQFTSLALEIATLERLCGELFVGLDDLCQSREQVMRAKTVRGKLRNLSGWFMTVVCIYRVLTAGLSVCTNRELFGPVPVRPFSFASSAASCDPSAAGSSASAACVAPAPSGVGRRAGARSGSPTSRSSMVSRSLSRAFSLLRVPVDVTFWSPYVSLFLLGVIIALNVRSFVERLVFAFRYLSASVGSSFVALVVSEMMGLYFAASAILLRVYLPEQYQGEVELMLGPSLNFEAFHAHFDFMFLLSSLVTLGVGILTRAFKNFKTKSL
eukprot:GHVT01039525.1.p1 GENE.GHVT01039525.1~~GHVT01039525.1.p1  ORF type:complete len:279 (+),score=54.74 GHVT01039525.1:314-1150(+)